ncbi:bifunctional glycosyltransferase/CDP-glycerol:glycerophosphate glycerophosphotransferase [Streptomyces apocyni]|uniref:bifunctional glycosyltransferase/CDP-glycerol:glycerophosphate glycerophosphotransferase n=1 Tax=Streptomyces apocyni TaxID=2654677 RepID=UPI001E578F99|nr:bifunctional glycosyltransferase family 2 protein/CDP-glycerol:glycerophosphate glycerophosphotransferase [Streptomyces apocyni]
MSKLSKLPKLPKLSVIVSGRDIQGHLGECLSSLADQSCDELEVIVAVTGDNSRARTESRTASDPRFTSLPLSDGTTPTAARRAGADAATGDWLHFLDAKDSLPTGAAAAIVQRLAEHAEAPGAADRDAPAPDVLVFDHVRAYWWDPARPSLDTKVLAQPGRALVDLADFPTLLELAPLLGNRVLRTGFLRAHAHLLTAGDALYSAYAALLLADRIACLDQVALIDRQLRRASLPPPTYDEHFAPFAAYAKLHELAAARQAPPRVRTALYERMVGDYLRVIARPGLLPADLAAPYFHHASEHASRFRPDGYQRPDGLDGVRHRLLEQDQYTRYKALQAANGKRRALRSALNARKRKLSAKARDHRYRGALSRPIEPELAVFSAYWDRGVACNPAAIAAKLRELAPHVHPVWVVSQAKAALLPPGTDHVIPGTPRYLEVLARAKFLVNNVNFPGLLVKRPEQVFVQTHHGTPLKRMGLDQREFPAAAKGLNFRALLARVDNWDYSVSANSHSTRTWERAYPSRYVPLDYGYPRNDVLYQADADDIRAIRERLGIAPGKTAILYAPTHRDYEAGWTPRLDLARLSADLGDDTVLLVRGHYFYGGGAASPLTRLRRGGRVIDVSTYDPVEELQLAADALVTDYSSIMFDYANLDRPIVIYADDWEVYARARGVYFDLLTEAPGQVARSQDALTEIFTSGAWRDEAAAKLRGAFRRRFCEFDDGRAAERVVRRAFLGEREEDLPPIVPVEDRTPAPTPEEAARR